MKSAEKSTSRRRFLAYFSSLGLSSTLLPGILWSKVQEQQNPEVTVPMLKDALAAAGLEFSTAEEQQMLKGVNQSLNRYEELRRIHIDPEIPPPFYFSPVVPGTRLDMQKKQIRISAAPTVRRPANLDDVSFLPLLHLAALIKTRQVTSTELTTMYLERLKRYNSKLNCVVTLTEKLAMEQAQAADKEIAEGK